MADIDYDVYVVKVPKERKGPGVWLMSEELVPGCNLNIMYNWIAKNRSPTPSIWPWKRTIMTRSS